MHKVSPQKSLFLGPKISGAMLPCPLISAVVFNPKLTPYFQALLAENSKKCNLVYLPILFKK